MEKEELRKKDKEAKQVLFLLRKGKHMGQLRDGPDGDVTKELLNVVRFLDHRLTNVERGIK